MHHSCQTIISIQIEETILCEEVWIQTSLTDHTKPGLTWGVISPRTVDGWQACVITCSISKPDYREGSAECRNSADVEARRCFYELFDNTPPKAWRPVPEFEPLRRCRDVPEHPGLVPIERYGILDRYDVEYWMTARHSRNLIYPIHGVLSMCSSSDWMYHSNTALFK